MTSSPQAETGSPSHASTGCATEPAIYEHHPLSREMIDPDAIKIVRRLQRHGHEAYLVGGCVRDLVLGVRPKDFDVATDATPQQIRALFRNCRVIGRRFRLCHVFFQDKIIEVATFRAEPLARLEEDRPDSPLLAAAAAGTAEGSGTAGDPNGARLATAPPAPPPRPPEQPRTGWAGLSAEELRAFQLGLLEEPASAAPPATGPAPEASPGAGAGPPPPPPPALETEEELAPWERDEESAAREEAAVRGRRARVEEEVAEALDGPTPPAAPPRPRRRRRRWERLLAEPPPQGYGTAAEDARLRDFTVNALFYDPVADRVIDYTGGWRDLQARVLRTIGDPDQRFIEDPVRILRAVKGATRAGLVIEQATLAAMQRQRHLLRDCSPRRLLEEVLKLLSSGAAAPAFRLMGRLGITPEFLPLLAPAYPADPDAPGYRYLEALDLAPRARLDTAVLIAALFYPLVCTHWERQGLGRPGIAGSSELPHTDEARAEQIADELLRTFAQAHALSRRARAIATRLLLAQRLMRRPPERRRRAARLVAREWFDQALTLLGIACAAERAEPEIVHWWYERARAVRSGGPVASPGGEEDEPQALARRRRRGRRGGRGRRRPGA
ncbi:MAG: hypothetical protein KatS3mg102_2690 [Planctomycetota bacterium]|nr:MAG: hypothetical protein KatS3mg102_2690 [Planctomycetota bacterium]